MICFNLNSQITFKLTYNYNILRDLIFFIFLLRDYLNIKSINTLNILKIFIFLLNLLAYKYLIYSTYNINYLKKKKLEFFKLYSIEIYYYICLRFNNLEFKRDVILKNIYQRILLVKKISRTRTEGRIKRYKVIVIIGNKLDWFGIGSGKDYYLTDAFTKAKINSFKNLFLVKKLYSNMLNSHTSLGNKSRKILLFSSKYKVLNSSNRIIRILFDFIGMSNIKSKIIKCNNVYNILNLILSL